MKRTNRFAILILVLAASLPLVAQQPASPKPEDKVVAMINGEVITQSQLDNLYDSLNLQMRQQYERAGGKAAFLDNYTRKRLLLQEALKQGFDKRPDVQQAVEAAKESALFDRYVKEVVSQQIVTDEMVRKYYDDHQKEDFGEAEQVKAYHIIVMYNGTGPKPKTKEQAQAEIQKVASDLREHAKSFTKADPAAQARVMLSAFSEAAKQYSEDGTAPHGGDLGWFERGKMDKTFEDVAFGLKPGTMSDPFETRFGFHIIYVEAHKAPRTTPFDEAKRSIRDKLIGEHTGDIMQTVTKLTDELKSSSKVALYPDNIRY
jgi:peptidyl-prolyl cis-trans isomerase C